jgi:hypothetical protein
LVRATTRQARTVCRRSGDDRKVLAVFKRVATLAASFTKAKKPLEKSIFSENGYPFFGHGAARLSNNL